MVERITNFFTKEVKGLHEVAYLLALFAFLSQILGLVRDRLFASSFGAGELLDVYYAAFRIPDLIFVIISALVSISVLVPLIVRFGERSLKEQKVFTDSIFTSLIVISIIIVTIVFITTPKILGFLFGDLITGQYGGDLIVITRILLIQPVILALSSLFSGFIQVYRRFFIYALGPILYNLGIIIGIVFLYPIYGIKGLVFGVVIGAFLHLLIQIPTVKKHGVTPKITLKPNFDFVKEVLKLSIPRTIALTGNQISLLILISFAGTMIAGSISVFSFSFNLQSVPLAIIGVSYSLAAFPTLSKLYAKGDIETFLNHIVKATRHIIFWSIPVAVMFIVLRAQIVRSILGAGEFSWEDTRLTAAALALFSVSVLAQSLTLLLVRGYYSAGETKKPLVAAAVSIVVTIAAAFLFINLFKTSEGFKFFIENLLRVSDIPGTIVLMLPLAYSLGQVLNTALLWVSFDRRYKCFSRSLWTTILHSVGASLVAGYVAFGMLRILDDVFDLETLMGVFLQGFFSGSLGLLVGGTILVLLGNQEIRTVWKVLHKKIWKAKFVGGE